MTTVQHCILGKGAKVFSIGSDDTVENALTMMRDNRIRSVMVIDMGKLVGILSQGDCAIKVLLPGKSAASTSVASVMTKNPLTVSYDNTLEECMAIMDLKRIRHLPVLHNGQVTGLISIGDIVKNMMSDQDSQIKFLETYIRGHGV
ncbi:MAG: CBS domain-containing protein [Orrella sp.]|jgi:CBS domain-containing protein|uniref:CBS domain-containing protein n=2 Tax=Orrella sp. TaxID=1921583 RepID=UPI003BD6962C